MEFKYFEHFVLPEYLQVTCNEFLHSILTTHNITHFMEQVRISFHASGLYLQIALLICRVNASS
jgi:hypothetical protein